MLVKLLVFSVFNVLLVKAQFNSVPTSCPFISQRSEWNAKLPKRMEYVVVPLQKVVTYRTHQATCYTKASCVQNMQRLQLLHMNILGFNDIGYNFIINGDGSVYEGIGWAKKSAHGDDKVFTVAFTGSSYNGLEDSQLEAFKRLIKCAIDLGELVEDYTLQEERRNDVPPITCMGIIPRREWNKLVINQIDRIQGSFECEYYRFLNSTYINCDNLSSCRKALSRLQADYLGTMKTDIPHHFVIDGSGNIYECLGWYKQVSKFKDKCIDIVILGANSSSINDKQMIGYKRLLQCASDLNLFIGMQ